MALSFLLVAGCYEIDPATVASRPTMDVCYGIVAAQYGNAPASGGQIGLDELRRRGEFSRQDLAMIAAGDVKPGMTERAAICAKGLEPYDINTTVTSGATRRQLVYGDGKYSPRNYVYTTNGVVTGVQF